MLHDIFTLKKLYYIFDTTVHIGILYLCEDINT